jgi:MobA-like NTP transferase domain
MSKCWCVIPAAGGSKRFFEAGYKTLKPFLWIKSDGVSRSMLGHVLATVPDNCEPIIALPAGAMRPTDAQVELAIVTQSKGQADTVYQVVKKLPKDDEVLILDCDTILRKEDLSLIVDKLGLFVAGVAVTKNVLDGNMSRIDNPDNPQIFVEKQFISSWAIIGARAFHCVGYLVDVLERYLVHCKATDQEPHLTPAMNLYEGKKYALIISSIHWKDWGTPERIDCSGDIILTSKICE